jgi:FMN phosphatase YigB (HAD superfamily)
MIKVSLLDFGGVIADVNFAKTKAAFERLGVKNFEEAWLKAEKSSLFAQFEQGKLSSDGFRKEIRKHFGLAKEVQDADIDDAWCAMLCDIPDEKIICLEKLVEKGYRMMLFSNITPIHLARLKIQYPQKMKRLEEVFENCYYSCKFGHTKNSLNGFNALLEDAELKASEVLFIDDSAYYVENAKQAGLKAFHLDLDKGQVLEKEGLEVITQYAKAKQLQYQTEDVSVRI